MFYHVTLRTRTEFFPEGVFGKESKAIILETLYAGEDVDKAYACKGKNEETFIVIEEYNQGIKLRELAGREASNLIVTYDKTTEIRRTIEKLKEELGQAEKDYKLYLRLLHEDVPNFQG